MLFFSKKEKIALQKQPCLHTEEATLDKYIRQYWGKIQGCFAFADDLSEQVKTPKHIDVIIALDCLDIPKFFTDDRSWLGRPKKDRSALACAFIAKSVLNIPTTQALIDRLSVDRVLRRICLFSPLQKLPCSATFSNAFAEFSESELPNKIHEYIIKKSFSEKFAIHISRDSTDICGREKTSFEKKAPWKRLKGKKRRLVRQGKMSLQEMMDDLPKNADHGRKNGFSWDGYKLHLDVADGDIPVSAILTSASLHDSQAAIPLEKLTCQRLQSCYSLMDSAYDAKEIRDFVTQSGKVSIISPQNRTPQPNPLDPAQKRRLDQRNSVERVNSRIKDRFGGRSIWVKQPKKVMAHLMFGVCALTALQIVKYI